jgi:PhzF family phenazine biosynthesis protein
MSGSAMHIPIFLVDAFADVPFAGNAAAVCLLDSLADATWMQAVAAELRQPATTFVHPVRPGQSGGFGLRWFVPGSELVLCGHGTLATAHVLWETGRLALGAPAHFETGSGTLAARRDGDVIALDFPAEPVEPVTPPPHLVEALGVEARDVARGRLDYLVELESEQVVRTLQPDFARLRQVETRGVIVTARSETPGYDVVSRFFAPGVDLDEDAVTGSAHCSLGPYWGERLGRTTLTAFQASARGGMVQVRLEGSRVRLSGRAVTVMRGFLLAPPPPV